MTDNTQNISRRDFMIASTLTAGALGALPPLSSLADPLLKNSSAAQTPLGVKFIVNGILHEAAFEGSCRYGDLKNLTFESEKKQLKHALAEFKKEMADRTFHPAVKLLPPSTTHLYVEKGNPDIMLKDAQLNQLKKDDSKTDVYVIIGGGIPQFTAFRVAETFKKPVIIMQEKGWAIDAAAGIRARGLEGWYVQNWEQLDQMLRVLQTRKAIQHTRVLRITNFPNRPPRGVISAITDFSHLKTQYGIEHETLNYDHFFQRMDQWIKDKRTQEKANAITNELVRNAIQNNMHTEDVKKSVLFYLTVKQIMDEHESNAFLMECFELCSSMQPWHRRFTPCLTNALLKDAGYPAACEHDTSALMAMMVEMYLSQKAIYMGNPDFDLKANTITLHHSVASLKMHGIHMPDTPFQIRAFTHSGFGVTLRHDFTPEQHETITAARFDPTGTKILTTSGAILSSESSQGCGCAQSVTFRVDNAKRVMRAQQNFGHHLSMVFGDYVDDIALLGELMKFDVIEA